jgi:hypothetical protein
VNRIGHVQLKENLEKKMALMKLKDIFQHEHAWPKSCAIKIFKVEKKVGIKSMVLR